ncbi:hypothetical protein J6590_102314 [Homalodisca vitripennis]|nr:hypothetical protein J6590_037680 [Homalodisca vitripennis]KAG8333838.1 hypothetical protein J6590_102314 [Homalodisca vitripennis]
MIFEPIVSYCWRPPCDIVTTVYLIYILFTKQMSGIKCSLFVYSNSCLCLFMTTGVETDQKFFKYGKLATRDVEEVSDSPAVIGYFRAVCSSCDISLYNSFERLFSDCQ